VDFSALAVVAEKDGIGAISPELARLAVAGR